MFISLTLRQGVFGWKCQSWAWIWRTKQKVKPRTGLAIAQSKKNHFRLDTYFFCICSPSGDRVNGTWLLHLMQPCLLALGRILIWVCRQIVEFDASPGWEEEVWCWSETPQSRGRLEPKASDIIDKVVTRPFFLVESCSGVLSVDLYYSVLPSSVVLWHRKRECTYPEIWHKGNSPIHNVFFHGYSKNTY